MSSSPPSTLVRRLSADLARLGASLQIIHPNRDPIRCFTHQSGNQPTTHRAIRRGLYWHVQICRIFSSHHRSLSVSVISSICPPRFPFSTSRFICPTPDVSLRVRRRTHRWLTEYRCCSRCSSSSSRRVPIRSHQV
jgi:hypothetical protein